MRTDKIVFVADEMIPSGSDVSKIVERIMRTCIILEKRAEFLRELNSVTPGDSAVFFNLLSGIRHEVSDLFEELNSVIKQYLQEQERRGIK